MKVLLVSVVIAYRKNDSGDFSLWMQKRSEDGPLDGFLEFPGGKIESDEKPIECAIRELEEEVGVTLKESDLNLFKIYPYEYSDRKVSLFVFITSEFATFSSDGWIELETLLRNKELTLDANQKILRDLSHSL